MNRLYCYLLCLLLMFMAGCSNVKQNEFPEYNVSFCNTNGVSFLLKENVLYGWSDVASKKINFVLDEREIIQANDVETFLYQDDNNLASYDGWYSPFDYRMLYVLKKDASLWMRGYTENVAKKQEHNYKKLTKVMGNVKCFYKKTGPGLYVIKTDNSLWWWQQQGIKYNGKKTYDFIKVMDDVEHVTVGENIDYALKKDGSLWSIDSYQEECMSDGYICLGEVQKKLDNVQNCKVAYSSLYLEHDAFAIDDSQKLWAWGDLTNNAHEDYTEPRVIMNDVKDVMFLSLADDNVADEFALKTDDSLWLLTEKDSKSDVIDSVLEPLSVPSRLRAEPIKVLDNVEKVHVVNGRQGVYILDKKNRLWQYINDSCTVISQDVLDFAPVADGKYVWMLKEDNTLVDQNGKVHLENVDGIYTNVELFDEGIAISNGKIYALKADGIKEVFSNVKCGASQ